VVCGFHTIRGSDRCSTGFAFVVKVGKGDVVAALALLVGSVVFPELWRAYLSFGGLADELGWCGPLAL
jgi:hypothetical protein